MQIWIDADACPGEIRDIVFRASERLQLPVCFVANRRVTLPESPLIRSVLVGRDFNAADKHIAEAMGAGDIVVTADVPLAAAVAEKGGVSISPRGEVFDSENAQEKLSLRDFYQDLRSGGLIQGGPAPFSPLDRHRFASALDRELTKRLKDA
ncbi:MAG: YaiI/YqxD family protein [Candidatus Tectomicrobia bacterium]|uniref:UPF0178 protein HYZ11_02365 n=1 Tax=Tectimicrobiota bacterium TaxID=2528274 RepID=A0A932MNQ7_UNCTE|nr:YaiI/YqxD family protein [Candidatus Tectomicrobia bacterium]